MGAVFRGDLFLHYPCFDGVVSAVIAWDYLEMSSSWELHEIRPVNYDLRATWLETPLPDGSAVVDFLYHPGAAFWADHHGTTFLTAESFQDFKENQKHRFLLYDPANSSCAKLLWQNLSEKLSDPARYRELVRWADRTDSAAYDSVDEALYGNAPALEIARSLALGDQAEYCELLVRSLRAQTLDRVAALPEVRSRALEVRRRTDLGMDAIRAAIEEHDGIAVADVTETGDMMISRYSPYIFHPEARYSAVLVRSGDAAKITAMRNPWKDFESVQLGGIFERFGGGGHQRVGSVVMPLDSDPKKKLDLIIDAIRAEDAAMASS